MRYLGRTHRISVAWLHEVFKHPSLNIQYISSKLQRAYVCTKAFTDPWAWSHACQRACLLTPHDWETVAFPPPVPPPSDEGGAAPQQGEQSAPRGGHPCNTRAAAAEAGVSRESVEGEKRNNSEMANCRTCVFPLTNFIAKAS